MIEEDLNSPLKEMGTEIDQDITRFQRTSKPLQYLHA